MSVRITISLFVLAWIYDLNAEAQEQTAKLPEDGWWISYRSTIKEEFKGKTQQHTCKSKYSLVGTVTEDGQKLRWVEVNSEHLLGEKTHVEVTKFLVAEKDLIESDQPLDKLKRAWQKEADRDVREVSAWHGIFPDNTSLVIFPGMWQNAGREKMERTIDYQQAKLTIAEARTREVTTPVKTVNRPREGKTELKSHIEATAWFDPATSPVFAAAKFETKRYQNDKLQMTKEEDLVVEDSGTGAQSRLPDNN